MWSTKIEEDNGDVSEFYYLPNILETEDHIKLKEWLCEFEDFRDGEYAYDDKLSRKQIWIQKEGKYFCPNWKKRFHRWTAITYPDLILSNQTQIITKLNKAFGKQIMSPESCNSCLINKYRDGNDFIPAHTDSACSFGSEPTIIGLSIGETRNLKLNRKGTLEEEEKSMDFELKLADNSVFVMRGATQKYFTHEIPKDPTKKNVRYSLTFREYIQ